MSQKRSGRGGKGKSNGRKVQRLDKRPRKRTNRDYAGEYQRRIERGRRLGLDLSVARGHAKAGTLSIRVARSLKLPPGTPIDQIQLRPTGRLVDEGLVDREFEALARMGFNIQRLNALDFQDEEAFIKLLLDNGFTVREAYQLRFSP